MSDHPGSLRRALAWATFACGLWIGCHRAPIGAAPNSRLSVEFLSVDATPRMQAGVLYNARVAMRNTGAAAWTPDAFRLSYHWTTSNGAPVVRDGKRTLLPHAVPPGAEIVLCAVVEAPPAAGTYQLQWDLVQEGVSWFSAANPQNIAVQQVTVSPPAGALSSGRVRDTMRLLAFLVVTLGHFGLTSLWVWRAARATLRNPEEYAFFTIVVGFGSFQAVLQVLAATVGIGFTNAMLALLVLHVMCAGWLVRRSAHPRLGSHGNTTADLPAAFAVPRLAIPGIVVLLALLLQWYAVTAESLRVTGSDAAHYHIPHAVNFALGANLFGFVATPHLYPMGTSIWAAWVLQPLEGPALLDLVTLPAVVLLIVSVAWLCRVVTGASGLVWGPWLVLLMLTAPLLRVSLLPSADLMYAAAFVALFTQCFVIWRTAGVRSMDLMSAAFCGGLLVGSKTTGVISAALIVGLFVLLCIGRRLGPRKQGVAWRVGGLALSAALLALVVAGAIWLVRNWVRFGSPLAPSGLTVAGLTIFPGEAYLEGGYYNSVLKDLRDVEGYSLVSRFAFYARRLLGTWFLPSSLLLTVLVIDVLGEWRRRRTLSEITTAKLWFLATTSILAVVHVAILVPAPWTSLEWTRGLALRYVLPLLILYMVQMAFCLFSTELSRWLQKSDSGVAVSGMREAGNVGARVPIALGAMTVIAAIYARRGSIPGLPQSEWFPVFDWKMLLVAATAVVSWYVLGGFGRRWRLLATVPLVAIVAWLSYRIVAIDSRLMAESRATLESRAACLVELPSDSDHRCVFFHTLAFERRSGLASGQRRFFLASRFDAPLELQGAALDTLVFDVRGRTEFPPLLDAGGPGTGPRDYLVIDAREVEGGQSSRLAYQVGARAGLVLLGRCGRYHIYSVPSQPGIRIQRGTL